MLSVRSAQPGWKIADFTCRAIARKAGHSTDFFHHRPSSGIRISSHTDNMSWLSALPFVWTGKVEGCPTTIFLLPLVVLEKYTPTSSGSVLLCDRPCHTRLNWLHSDSRSRALCVVLKAGFRGGSAISAWTLRMIVLGIRLGESCALRTGVIRRLQYHGRRHCDTLRSSICRVSLQTNNMVVQKARILCKLAKVWKTGRRRVSDYALIRFRGLPCEQQWPGRAKHYDGQMSKGSCE